MHAVPTKARPWYTERWPWLLMLGPAIVLVGGARLGYLAVRHEDAMVVDDYYKQGKAINQDLRRDRVATAMRLSFSARYDPARGAVEGTIASAGIGLAKPFRIHLAHATIPSKDILLVVQPDAAGNYSVALPLFEGGRWRVVVEGQGRDWRLAGTWDWPKRQAIAIAADPAAAAP
jgi:hypothetical protein